MTFLKKAMLPAMLLRAATVLCLLLPCYAQQETDPTWYDPWANPSPVVANVTKPRAAQPVKAQAVIAKMTDQRTKVARKTTPAQSVTTAKLQTVVLPR